MKRIYLAAPYTHHDIDVVNNRVRAIDRAAATLIKKGYLVFSPISHSHHLAKDYELPTDFEYWKKLNHSFIDWCDCVLVLTLPGWSESKGIDDEMAYADTTRKPVSSATMEGVADVEI